MMNPTTVLIIGAGPVGLTLADDKVVIKAYGLTDGIVMIRPDGYIALLTVDPDEVHRYLNRFRQPVLQDK